MIFNKNLAIVVPTYNRAQILKVWLECHAQLMFSKNIQIHIQDNRSTDGTKQLLEEWKKRFENITFETNKKNIGPKKNLQKAINTSDSRFVWMVGDSYFISRELINKILLKIKSHSPLFFIINLKEHIKILKDKYMQADFVCEKISGVLSCISCIIYNKDKLGNINFKNISISYFPHTVYILDQLKNHNSKAYWISSSIYKLSLPYQEKKNWANTSFVFEIGCKNWIDSINSIIGYSSKSKKKAFKLFSDITNLFSWKGGFWLRAQGLLTINKIKNYKIYLNKSVGKKYLMLYFIAILPVFPLKVLKKIYDQCLKK
jgi:glycosyltransferase involved in cell wall biosynthesis